VITRVWHGWTAPENAGAFEHALRCDVLPGIRRIGGYRGAYLLRRDLGGSVEFATLTLFASMDAVRAFAGDDVERAVIDENAGWLLSRFDERSVHYETVLEPSEVLRRSSARHPSQATRRVIR
jgi:heme-degrading monooxygenase HmoA